MLISIRVSKFESTDKINRISLFMVFSTILNQGVPAGTHIQIIWKLP